MEQCAGRNDRNSRTERSGGRTVRIAERKHRRNGRQAARRKGKTERCGERLFKRRRQEEPYGQQSLHGLSLGEPWRPGKQEIDSFRIRPAVRSCSSVTEEISEEVSGGNNRKHAGNGEYAADERIGYADSCNGRMTEESLRQFERHLQQEGKKASTVEKYLRDVKAFWFWLRETGKENKKSAEEACGGSEERRSEDPASCAGGEKDGTDIVSGVRGGYGADIVSGGREKEYGTDIAYDIRESRAETSVISDTGGRDERSVREADETDNVYQIGEKGADKRMDFAEENEGRKHGGRDLSGGENSAVEENTDSLSASAAVTKAKAWQWRDVLCEKGYAPVTVNAMLTALNLFFRFLGREDCRVKTLRIQRKFFRSSERELCRREYEQLVRAAKEQGKQRLALLIETMGATGIRVSEVKYITVEAVRQGRAEIALKGKIRTILIPDQLKKKLRQYAGEKGISSGEIFITKSGKGLSRQQIWAEMKRLCPAAGILKTKVFPHNLRHLFARAFYRVCRDIVKLADVLGHSHIATTRIYLTSTGEEHARHLERLHLVSRM